MTIFDIFEKLNKILERLDDIYHYIRGEKPPED